MLNFKGCFLASSSLWITGINSRENRFGQHYQMSQAQNQPPYRKHKSLEVNHISIQESLDEISLVFCDLHTSGKQATAAYAVQQH